MATRVTLHRFESDPALPQRDGVNLAHAEINRLLGGAAYPELQVEFHDFSRLMRDRDYAARTLAGVDCVLCNVGPHAHYYHHIRERLGLDFRIVRDIKTALWSAYLLQESLCQPYLRAGDALLATSHYSRVLTQHLFPHLRGSPIHLFEPVLAAPEGNFPPPSSRHRPDESVTTLGYVGRLSEDKNFPQAVDLLIALDREEPGRYRLVAVGAVHSATCEPGLVAERVRAATGRNDLFAYRPPVGHEQVGSVLSGFDYFLFFSTSNLEVLGRVLVEAADAQVPILAADHAAAAELLAPSSLLDVTYVLEREFHSHFDAPLGRIDVAKAADKIRRREIPQAPPRPAINRPETLLSVLSGRAPAVGDGISRRTSSGAAAIPAAASMGRLAALYRQARGRFGDRTAVRLVLCPQWKGRQRFRMAARRTGAALPLQGKNAPLCRGSASDSVRLHEPGRHRHRTVQYCRLLATVQAQCVARRRGRVGLLARVPGLRLASPGSRINRRRERFVTTAARSHRGFARVSSFQLPRVHYRAQDLQQLGNQR